MKQRSPPVEIGVCYGPNALKRVGVVVRNPVHNTVSVAVTYPGRYLGYASCRTAVGTQNGYCAMMVMWCRLGKG